MILGHIDNVAKETEWYSQSLQKGFQYLQSTDFSQLEDGKHCIDGINMFAIISRYKPEPKEQRRPEAHQKYIDIQYIISGEEIIAYSHLTATATVVEDLLAEKDVIFFSNRGNEIDITVSPGMYAVFFPWDIHRPNCMSQPDLAVRKVVLKIKMED
jgi:biofilm protein TabA